MNASNLSAESYVIVDDFIDSGTTVRRIISKINEARQDYQLDSIHPAYILLYEEGIDTTIDHHFGLNLPLKYVTL